MKKLFFGFLIFFVTLSATAQEQSGQQRDTIILDLSTAVEIALQDNPTIRIADTEIARQDYVRKETVGKLLPNLSATGNYTYNVLSPVMFIPAGGPFGEGGMIKVGYDHSFNGGLTLGIPVFAPALYANLTLNQQQMEEAVEKARSSKIELSAQVKKSYYGVLLAKSSLELIEQNISLAQDVVDDSRNAFEEGTVSEYDLITSEVQLSNLTPSLYQAQSALHNAQLLLNMLLGLPLDIPVMLDENLEDFAEQIAVKKEYNLDLSTNSELNLLNIQDKMLDTQLDMQKAARTPTISAFGQFQALSQNNTLDIGSYDWAATASVGLQVNVPIFSGMSNINKERQILNQQSQLKLQKDYREQGLQAELEGVITNIESARSQMSANITAKEQAQKGYEISLVRYEMEMGTIVELNSAQVQLIQADMNYRQSIYDYMTAMAEYDKVVGAEY